MRGQRAILRIAAAGVMTLAGFTVTMGIARMEETNAEAEVAARKLIDDFFVAFNAEDNEALQKIANYPHAFLLDNGRMAIANGPEELVMDFDAMKKREGWHHSSLGEYTVSNSAPEKVHVELTFNRHKEDGTIYRTVPALWIVTKQDGEWGLQFRSLMPATFSAPE